MTYLEELEKAAALLVEVADAIAEHRKQDEALKNALRLGLRVDGVDRAKRVQQLVSYEKRLNQKIQKLSMLIAESPEVELTEDRKKTHANVEGTIRRIQTLIDMEQRALNRLN